MPRGSSLDRFSDAKRALLERRLGGEAIGATSADPIAKRTNDGPPPVSSGQQRLWYLDQLEPNTAVHNLPSAYQLTGVLDRSALTRSIQEIARRHDILRTRFSVLEGVPVQHIAPPLDLELPLVDVSNHPVANREAELAQVLEGEVRKPFDLATGPLFRPLLLRLHEAEHVLLVVAHHTIWDGWSSSVFWHELASCYSAFVAEHSLPLSALPIQYADYAVWQREWLDSGELARQLEYWRRQLSGEIPALAMPTDRPRPAVQTYHGAVERLELPSTLAHALVALGQEEHCTLYMVLLAAFQTLLVRYTGQEQVLVGTPIANRTRAETGDLIGFFANILVMRTRFDGEPTFREVLRRVRDVSLAAYGHQDVPFERLVEQLNPERDLSRTPLFQAILAFQDATDRTLELPELTCTPVKIARTVAPTDLSLWLERTGKGLSGALEYNTDLFNADTITRIVDHFRILLEGAVADPDQHIDALSILTGAERRQLLVDWNATERALPGGVPMHGLVEAQVARVPERPAVVAGGRTLSYRGLDERANRLARHLLEQGVGPHTLVGISLPRTEDLLIGLLGILKTGAAYLPLDPDFPLERLRFMLEDAAVPVLVTHSQLLQRLPTHTGPTVCLDTDAEAIGRHRSERPDWRGATSELAYTIYTSGSTGKPKGVEVSHANVVNFLLSMAQTPGMRETDTLVAVTTLSFDIAVLELFLPLTTGACVAVASHEVAGDGHALAALLKAVDASVLQATPATWRLLIDAGWQGDSALKVLCGGEALPVDLAHRLTASCAEVWNLYGPTETTIWSSCWRVPEDVQSIRIGRPIANTQLYVLDAHMQPVPVGVPGELYVGGQGVTRGYRNRPELTAECFVSDPFHNQPDARLYRTGDIVQLHDDGQLEYLHRLDTQVKIRGFRIELGEIEAVLRGHEAVKQAVVTVPDQSTADARLAAYVVFQSGQQMTVSEVRRYLRKHVPDYMVPGFVIEMDALPMTPNGKLDRKALRNPMDEGVLRNEYVAPETSTEHVVADVWRKLLKVERVGRHDNFFELGGHSILSLQAVAAIERQTGNRLVPRLMFFHTVEHLANALDSGAKRA